MYRDIPPELRALIEPIVEDHGYELVDVDVRRGRPPWLVRITIDTPQGDGRVPIDRCADVSREVGTQLDAEDAIERTYRLEVSSPGLTRVLARERDFAAACGCEVSLETRRPLDGPAPVSRTARELRRRGGADARRRSAVRDSVQRGGARVTGSTTSRPPTSRAQGKELDPER